MKYRATLPWNAARAVACVLLIAIVGCEKKTVPPPKPSIPSVPSPLPDATTRPVDGHPASGLPAATRYRGRDADVPTTFPADLPDNPDIPKPWVSGQAPSIAREIVAIYAAAVRSPNDAEKIGELGVVFHRLGSITEAVTCFSRAAKLDPRTFKWHYFLALAHEAAFDATAAIAALKDAEVIDPTYYATYLKLGDLSRLSDPKAARAYYSRALQITPGDSRIYYGLGLCDLAEGRKDDAFRNFKRAVELAPRFADAHRELVKQFQTAGDQKQASIHQALADQGVPPPVILDPLYLDLVGWILQPEPLMALSKQLVDTGQSDLAIRILERALKWEPEAWDVRQQLGVIYLQNGRYADAQQNLQEVLRGDPSRAHIRSFLAQALIELGRLPEAEAMLTAAMQAQPESPEPFARYADFLLTTGRAKEAEEMYGRVTRAQPGNVLNSLGGIVALVCQKKYDQAANLVKQVVQNLRQGHDIANPLVNQFALLLVEQKKADPTHTRKAALDWADLDRFSDQLAKQGLVEEGRKIRDVLGTLATNLTGLADRGEFAQAVRLAQKVLPLDQGGRIRDAFRTVYLALQKKHADAAAAFMRDCIQSAEAVPQLGVAIAWIMATSPDAAQRDGAKAVSLAEKGCAATNNSDSEFLDTLAAAYAELGRFDDAVRTAQQAIQVAEKAKADGAIAPYKARLALYASKKPYRAG